MEHDSSAYASDVFMFPFSLCSVKLNHNELVAELRILVAARARGDRPRCAFCCLPDLLNWLSLHAKTAFVKNKKKQRWPPSGGGAPCSTLLSANEWLKTVAQICKEGCIV